MPWPRVLLWLSVTLVLAGDGLSWVEAALCPTKCTCDDDTLVVKCNSTNLSQMVPITLNPGVKKLLLTYCEIRSVIATLSFYKDLEFLDLSHNQLTEIETHGLEAQEKLKVLILSHNQIGFVINDTFFGPHSLKLLRMDNNSLQTIQNFAFVHLRSLDELDLNNNLISSLSPAAFDGLLSLRTLRLRQNRLKNVPTAALKRLNKLTLLDVSGNKLKTLAAKSFASLRALQFLYLNGCALQDPLPNASFEGLIDLRFVNISNNFLRSVPVALNALARLEELDVGENAIEELEASAFRGLRHLRSLDVCCAPRLTVVRKHAFSANADLERVRLVDNPRLEQLEVGAFEGSANLRHLSLRGNMFSSLSEGQLPWEELETLDLRHNPLRCNCSLLWLRDLLANRNLSSEGAFPVATCHSPSSVRGRSVSELSADDLSCYFADVRQQMFIGIAVAVVVACVATLIIVALKYRSRVTSALKDKWSDGALRRKEHQYEKTNDDEENNMLHATAQQPMKMTPVTEFEDNFSRNGS